VKEHLESTPVLSDLCKFAMGHFNFEISFSINRALPTGKRISYWLQKVSNPDFVRGYERFNLVVSALLRHVAAMQVYGAELEALCKEDQELQAMMHRCEQRKERRVLVTTRPELKSDGYCFWLQACNKASDIKYFEDWKSLQEAVEHLPPQPQQHKKKRVTDMPAAATWDEWECQLCGSTEDDEMMVLCDQCDGGYHIDCLKPALLHIPDGEWLCADCSARERTAECPSMGEGEPRFLAEQATDIVTAAQDDAIARSAKENAGEISIARKDEECVKASKRW